MAELKIDGIEVELGDARLVFSKAAYSFENWLQKPIAISERIRLPKTTTLDNIFFRPLQPEISAQKFSLFHTFKYLDFNNIIFSGTCKLLESNSNEYEFQLLDRSFELFEQQKTNLNSINLESSDFVFNATSYNNLKILNSSVWIWSASSMHQSKILSKNILSGNLAFSRPFFSVKRLLESSFSASGWNYELSANAEELDKLIISANSVFLFTSYEKTFSGAETSGDLILTGYSFLKSDTVGATTLTLTYNSKIRLRGSADADNDFTLSISSATETQSFIFNTGEFDYDLTSNEFNSGDVLTISIAGTGSLTFTDFLIYTIIDENDFGNISLANFTDFKVKTYDNLPEIVQKELFKHALVSVSGFFTTDNFRKKIKVNSLTELSKMSALDWSDKFIEDSETVKPLTNYAKINYFEYDNSKENPTNLGRGTFQINDETIQETTTIYKSIFAASNEVVITDTMLDNTVYDDTERINELNDLIGYYEVIGAYTVARFNKLNGNTILSNYYSNFIQALQKGTLIEAQFNLNKSDYFLFDFTQLIYVKQLKSTFYVSPISDFSEGELSTVTLLKL